MDLPSKLRVSDESAIRFSLALLYVVDTRSSPVGKRGATKSFGSCGGSGICGSSRMMPRSGITESIACTNVIIYSTN